MLGFRGENAGMKSGGWTDIDKLHYSMRLHKELDQLYQLISKLVIIAETKGLQLIIENPYSAQHYLKQYWCIKPALIDTDRSRRGDWFKKPTQYFFINRQPQQNICFDSMEFVETKRLKWDVRNATKRSMIHPQYANRFIREFILGEEFEQQEQQLGME